MNDSAEYDFLKENSDTENVDNSALEKLGEQTENKTDSRLEERFCWILVTVILLNILFLRESEGWAFVLSTVFLELILMIIVARKCGIEDLTNLLDKYLWPYSHKLSSSEDRKMYADTKHKNE